MEGIYPYWLSKQMLSGVRGFNIDSFLVALEGWRRGLTLKFYGEPSDETDLKLIGFDPSGKVFSLSSSDKSHFFYRSRGDKVSNEAVDIGTSKERTKQYLKGSGISVPEGFGFHKNDDLEKIIQSALKMGFPLVLKPTFGSLGKGVVTNIQTEDEIRDSIAYVYSEFDYQNFIIEQHISGEDVRVYVIEDRVVGATKRVPANVTGDGIHTIEELIELKNKKRKLNPHTSTRFIKVDNGVRKFIDQQILKLENIPEEGKVIYVKGQSNISSGGDSIDVTDELEENVKSTAIQAVKAVPGLYHAGVDLIMNENGSAILEINATAGISLHTFPLYGTQQNIAEKIIDYYFPETKGEASKSTKIYFDYKTILDILRNKSMKQVEVADAPLGELFAKRYVISGKVQKVGYRRWIREQALSRDLHGYTRNLNSGKVVVVVAGTNKESINRFKEVCQKGPDKAEVTEIKEYLWEAQVRVGFEIRRAEGKPKRRLLYR